MKPRLTTLASIGLVLVAGAPVRAQSVQTGSIQGVISDKTGRPLPGAKIRARSAQTERTVVANGKGEYRLPLLNVGEWTLTVLVEGFHVSTVKTRVEMNDTRIANFTLMPTAQAVVEVIDAVGSVDPTSAQVAVNIDATELAKIPINMTSTNALDGIMAAMPGVQMARTGAFNIMGGTDGENVFTLDGTVTNMTSTGRASVATNPAREFIESVEIVTNAFGAEYGAYGGAINTLTKSGTNSFGGSLFYGTNFPGSQAREYYNPDTTPPQTKPGEFHKYHRYGGSASGPVVKDKVYYFVGFQGFSDKIPPTTLENGGLNAIGLKSDTSHHTGPNQWTAKINWFINADHQLILSGTRSEDKSNTGNQYVNYGTLNQGSRTETTTQTVNLTWNWMVTPNLYLVASAGTFKNPSVTGPITGSTDADSVSDYNYFFEGPGRNASYRPADPTYYGYSTGSGSSPASRTDNPNTQVRLDLAWTLGKHQIKAGYLRQKGYFEEGSGGFNLYYIYSQSLDPYNYTSLTQYHADGAYRRYDNLQQSFFVKDIVEIMPGLRMDVGVRYDPFTYTGAFGPFNGMRLADYSDLSKQLQPRIGLVWDVDQNGRKKVFAHFGRFFQAMPMTGLNWATTSGSYYNYWYQGSWSYNADYQGGRAFTLNQPTPDLSLMVSGGNGRPLPRATELRLPRKNAWTVGTDWAVGNNWRVGGQWTFWEIKDAMEDSYFLNPDNSAAFAELRGQKVIWNPGPGTVNFLDSLGVQHTWTSDFPKPVDRYIGVNLHAANNGEWHYLSFDYTWTHHYGNYLGGGMNYLTFLQTGQQYGAGLGAGSTTDFDYARGITSGNYEANPVHELKARGGYRQNLLGQEFNFGFTATWQTGTGLTSTMAAGGKWQSTLADQTFGGSPYDTITTDNHRGDMGHTPSLLQVNLDLSATVKVNRFAIKPNITIENVFNRRTVLGEYLTRHSGYTIDSLRDYPDYGKIYSKQPGRGISAGVSIQF